MKAWLSRAGRSFVEKNVDEDDAAYNELLALGFRAVPVTLVGGRAVKGFDPRALAAALEAAG
ncbi:MAG TPA: glutaredoxin family protein [Vicinamibacterales bacterium]|nr:glutaredoxin family protein [Vicinamibacterales bacterium]